MKKNIILLHIALLALFSCNSGQELPMHNSTTQEVSPAEFASLKQLSFRHSQGLDAVYSQLASQSTRGAKSNGKQTRFSKELIDSLTFEFVSHLPEYARTQVHRTRGEQQADTTLIKLSNEATALFKSFFDNLSDFSNRNEAEAYIEQTTQKDSFKLLNKEEQQRLVFMMFVGIDSGSYWSTPENWNKWHALNGDSTTMVAAVKTTRGMAGPGASYWLTRKMMQNPRFRHTLLEDCIGCLLGSGSAVSWAIGGIVGSARAACE